MQRAVLPVAVRVPSIVPAVLGPVFQSDDQVERLVSVIVHVAPLVVSQLVDAGLVWLEPVGVLADRVGRKRQLQRFVETHGEELGMNMARRRHDEATAHVGRCDVELPRAETPCWFEDRELVVRNRTVA